MASWRQLLDTTARRAALLRGGSGAGTTAGAAGAAGPLRRLRLEAVGDGAPPSALAASEVPALMALAAADATAAALSAGPDCTGAAAASEAVDLRFFFLSVLRDLPSLSGVLFFAAGYNNKTKEKER